MPCKLISSYFRQSSALELNKLLTHDHAYFSQIQTMRIRCFIPVTPITHYKPDISVSNKTVNVRIKVIWGAFFQPLQQRKSNKYYIFRQCVCVFLALGTQCEILMNNILICGLSGCTIFFNIIPQILRFSGEKKLLITRRVLIFSTTLAETLLSLKRNERDIIKYVFWSSC